MNVITVRENKVVLVTGWIGLIAFAAILILSLTLTDGVKEYDISTKAAHTSGFAAFILLSLIILLDYYRRRLRLENSGITYSPMFGRKRVFSYSEIYLIKSFISMSNGRMTYRIINHEGSVMATFDASMKRSKQALAILVEKGVRFETEQSKIEVLLKYLANLNNRLNAKFNNKQREEKEYIMSRWDASKLQRDRKIVRIIGWMFIIVFIVSLFLTLKITLSTSIIILIFVWLMYLWQYPRMSIVVSNKECQIEIPIVVLLAICESLILTRFLSASEIQRFQFEIYYSIVFLIPFACILILRKLFTFKFKILISVMFAFAITFSTTMALHYVTTFTPAVHEDVIVMDKIKERGRSTSYYLVIQSSEDKTKMKVSSSMYESADVSDTVVLCKRTSIFDFEYWALHK